MRERLGAGILREIPYTAGEGKVKSEPDQVWVYAQCVSCTITLPM